MSVRWAFDGEVTEGTYCTAQGTEYTSWSTSKILTFHTPISAALKQIGNNGIALCTLGIAVLTWAQIVYPAALPPRRAQHVTCAIIGTILLFLILMIAIPSKTIPHYYGDTGLWCWITDDNIRARRMRIAGEYAWYWFASLVSIVLYGSSQLLLSVSFIETHPAERISRKHCFQMASPSFQSGR